MSSTQTFLWKAVKIQNIIVLGYNLFLSVITQIGLRSMFLSSKLSVTRAARRLQWILLSFAGGAFLIKSFCAGRRSNGFYQSKVLRVGEDSNQQERRTAKPLQTSKRKHFMAYES